MFLTKLAACSAVSAFGSSRRSLVPAAASRRRRTPRRIQTPSAPRSQKLFPMFLKNSPRARRSRRLDRPRDLSSPCGAEAAEDAETDSHAERAEVAELFPTFLKKFSACSAISAFGSFSAVSRPPCGAEAAEDAETDSHAERAEVAELFPTFLKNSPRARRSRRLDRSPRSLVPLWRRGGRGRRDGFTRRARRGRGALSDVLEKILHVLGDLGVWIVLRGLSSPCGAEAGEDAETDSNAERAEVAELFPTFLKNSPRARRSRRLDRSPRVSRPPVAPRRQRTPRRIHTPSAPRSRSSFRRS
jgi:hypothetical protein